MNVVVTIPLRTVSEANRHEHWRARQRRAKEHRGVTKLMIQPRLPMVPFLPVVVIITRRSPRQLDDDNLASSQKHVRDGVADALGIDDRDARVTWEYRQERAKDYAVRVEILRRRG